MKSKKGLKKYQNMDFDSDESSKLAYKALHEKKCLYDNYVDTYREMIKAAQTYGTANGGKKLELGSGGGFFKDICEDVITSDVTDVNGVDMVVDAQNLPFEDATIDVIYAVHVLHHIPDVCLFFDEVMRTVKPGGVVVLVEPYWSPVGKLFYKKFHPEPYDDKVKKWSFASTGAWSGANQALSYIVLKRDKEIFEKKYPQLKVVYDKPFNGLRYIATGGLWLRPILPQFCFPILTKLEKIFHPLMHIFGIHHLFVLRRM